MKQFLINRVKNEIKKHAEQATERANIERAVIGERANIERAVNRPIFERCVTKLTLVFNKDLQMLDKRLTYENIRKEEGKVLEFNFEKASEDIEKLLTDYAEQPIEDCFVVYAKNNFDNTVSLEIADYYKHIAKRHCKTIKYLVDSVQRLNKDVLLLRNQVQRLSKKV